MLNTLATSGLFVARERGLHRLSGLEFLYIQNSGFIPVCDGDMLRLAFALVEYVPAGHVDAVAVVAH